MQNENCKMKNEGLAAIRLNKRLDVAGFARIQEVEALILEKYATTEFLRIRLRRLT